MTKEQELFVNSMPEKDQAKFFHIFFCYEIFVTTLMSFKRPVANFTETAMSSLILRLALMRTRVLA